jgi:hypothetical protein
MELGLVGGDHANAALGDRARRLATHEHRDIAAGSAEIAGKHAADGTCTHDQYLSGHPRRLSIVEDYGSTLMPAARMVLA